MPQERIALNTHPYTHNLFTQQGDKEKVQAYSGPFVVRAQQWGALAVHTDNPNWTPAGGMVSPVVGPDVPSSGIVFQPPPPGGTKCNGDFHQSSQWVAASPLVPKWVISSIFTLGTTGACAPAVAARVQVYRLDAVNGLRYHGPVFTPGAPGGPAVIIGDLAYVPSGAGWVIVDLPTLGVGAPVAVLPPHDVQADIDGFTYSMSQIDNKHFELVRAGAQPQPEPGMNYFFPDRFVDSKRMAAYIAKTVAWIVDHPGQKLPEHPEQIFFDVPPGTPDPAFYTVINQAGAAGIMKGTPA